VLLSVIYIDALTLGRLLYSVILLLHGLILHRSYSCPLLSVTNELYALISMNLSIRLSHDSSSVAKGPSQVSSA
jgi:hypothetical protein